MSVQPVNSIKSTNNWKKYSDYTKISGYSALTMGALALLQGIRGKKSHRVLGVLSVALASIHVGIIDYIHRKVNNSK